VDVDSNGYRHYTTADTMVEIGGVSIKRNARNVRNATDVTQ